MKTFPKTSLVVSTYNWPKALQLCLLSIKKQSILPDEVIIADDGSTNETAELIESMRSNFPAKLVHIWHEDNGFHLSRIRNKAIAVSSNDYIIQIDGDLVLSKHFVRDHLSLSNQGTFVTGSRVLMNQTLSTKLLKHQKTFIHPLEPGLINFHNGFRITWLSRYMADRYKTKNIYALRGCNMSFWRSHLIQVNGYNENFSGWGGEDSEIAIRLINLGLKKRAAKFGGIAYHIFHKEVERSNCTKNKEFLLHSLKHRIVYCEKGIDQYLQS